MVFILFCWKGRNSQIQVPAVISEEINANDLCFMMLPAGENDRKREDNELNDGKAEVFIGQGPALWVVPLCLFGFCKSLIVPEGETSHYRREKHDNKTKTDKQLFMKEDNRTILWADAWKSPRLSDQPDDWNLLFLFWFIVFLTVRAVNETHRFLSLCC